MSYRNSQTSEPRAQETRIQMKRQQDHQKYLTKLALLLLLRLRHDIERDIVAPTSLRPPRDVCQ